MINIALTRNREPISILERTVWPNLVPKAGPISFIFVRFFRIFRMPVLMAMGIRFQCMGKNLVSTLLISSSQSSEERTAWAGSRLIRIKTRPPHDPIMLIR